MHKLLLSYIDSLDRSVTLLKEVLKSTDKKCNLEVAFLPVFSLLKKINIDEQKRLLEIWAGHKITYFGNSLLSYQQVEAKLLENLSPAILDLIREFQMIYEDHFVFSSKISNLRVVK